MGRTIQGLDTGPECALWPVEEPMGSGRSLLPFYVKIAISVRSGLGCALE